VSRGDKVAKNKFGRPDVDPTGVQARLEARRAAEADKQRQGYLANDLKK